MKRRIFHPIVNGWWHRQIGPWGPVKLTWGWPYGALEASWQVDPDLEHPALVGGALVRVMDGGLPVFTGLLQEPAGDGQIHVRGIYSPADATPAIDATGAATRNPAAAVAAAVARGALPWQVRDGWIGEAEEVGEGSPVTIRELLDTWADGVGVRWGIATDGPPVVYVAPDPTVVTAVVPRLVRGRGLTLATDEYASHLIGIYIDTGGAERVTPAIGSDPASQRWGRREALVDLTVLGPISEAEALQRVQGKLLLAGAQMGWADSVELGRGDVTNPGGGPFPPSMLRPGILVRLEGTIDPQSPARIRAYTDIALGEVAYDEATDIANVKPTANARRTLAELLEVS